MDRPCHRRHAFCRGHFGHRQNGTHRNFQRNGNCRADRLYFCGGRDFRRRDRSGGRIQPAHEGKHFLAWSFRRDDLVFLDFLLQSDQGRRSVHRGDHRQREYIVAVLLAVVVLKETLTLRTVNRAAVMMADLVIIAKKHYFELYGHRNRQFVELPSLFSLVSGATVSIL